MKNKKTLIRNISMPHMNKKAFDRNVILSDGSEKKLSQLWGKETVVLVFLRHFG
jgi:hypothetical protein